MLPPITPVVRMLLILNIGIFILDNMVGLHMLALYLPGSDHFYPFQIVTYMFMHANIQHIVFNMLALVMFGSLIERIWGPRRFLFFYLACGVGAMMLHYGVTFWQFNSIETHLNAFLSKPNFPDFLDFFKGIDSYYPNVTDDPAYREMSKMLSEGDFSQAADIARQMGDLYQNILNGSPLVGASGSIFGLLVAFGLLMPEAEMMLLFFPVPVKAKYFIPVLLGIELLLGMGQFRNDNVAHFAHLGGALIGALIILWWWRRPT